MGWNLKELKDYLYYEEKDPDIKIYHGDCLAVMPMLPKVDLTLTDPPYGIGYKYLSYEDSLENLRAVVVPAIAKASKLANRTATFCGLRHVFEYPKADWIIAWAWRGTNTYGDYGVNQWQPILCYGSDVKGFGSINGIIKGDAIHYEGGNSDEIKNLKDHPCPKNVGIIKRLILRLSNGGDTVLDPFLGSGTTLVACKELNRNGIGIEINEKYCGIAKKRLRATTKSLFTTPVKCEETQRDLL